MMKRFYGLAKPGIIYGNLITTVAAFLFASRLHIDALLLLATVAGLGLVIGSACVFNNYIDRFIDARMERTRLRALVTGSISHRAALLYGVFLGILGFGTLASGTNLRVVIAAAIGFVFYVVCYSIAKRAGYWGTLVGSVSGAMPIVVGYVAVAGRFDSTALTLFLILALWQMPHFYAIALRREDDYRSAGIPVLPVAKGIPITKRSIVLYIAVFALAAETLALSGRAGIAYAAVVAIACLWWIARAVSPVRGSDDARWARRVFLASLVALLAFCAALALSPLMS